MKIAVLPFALCAALLLVPAATQGQSPAKLFTVNNSGDNSDSNPGDRICADANGQCTFRAAVEEVNEGQVQGDIINFALTAGSVIQLTQGISISSFNTSIVGPGARRLTIRPALNTPPFRLIFISGSGIVFRGLTLRNANGYKAYPGAAIATGPGTVRLAEVAIVDNSTATNGGAVANGGEMTIDRSLLSGNTGFGRGGAIYNPAGASLRMINSTLTGNGVGGSGAGVWNAGSVLLVNCTLADNIAASSGPLDPSAHSIFNETGGTVSVLNTIIDGDVAGSPATSLIGAFTSLGNNIVTDARSSTGFTNGINNDQVSNNGTIDPLLEPLGNTGGQTNTRALQSGSPAINAGNNCVWTSSCAAPAQQLRLFWDQRRGFLRGGIFDAVDIGASEFNGATGSASSGIVGSFVPNPTGRYLGSIAVITNSATNEKVYRPVKANGRFAPTSFGNEVYILELLTKRSPGIPPSVIAVPD